MYAQIADYNKTPVCSDKLEVKTDYLWWQEQGLSYTASGYGKKIPTHYKVKNGGRWQRVYCCTASNIGSLYIISNGKKLAVEIYD